MVVFTAVITVLFGTPLTLVQVVGGLLVIAGVLLTGLKGQARSAGHLSGRAQSGPPAAASGRQGHAGSPVTTEEYGRSTARAARHPAP